MQENKLDPLKNKYYIHFGHVSGALFLSCPKVNRRMDSWMTAIDILPYKLDNQEVCIFLPLYL